MAVLLVDGAAATLTIGEARLRCSIGRTGAVAAAAKREGDGATPIGRWPLRGILLRPDRVTPFTASLPWRWLRRSDGWCDDPGDRAYNRPVRLPYPARAETLWRTDDAYDAIVVLGYNDAPPFAGAGSAIFLHCRPPTGTTAGCVALDRGDLIALLPRLAAGDILEVVDPAGRKS